MFARLRDAPIPTFAFINGAAMGGGLELALHCHYRTLSPAPAALALPEVSLGLVPGWGGTQLLPNLIGIASAAQVIMQNPLTQNQMLRPAQAAELGIADVLFEPADFLERSLEWAAGVVRGDVTVQRAPRSTGEMWDGVLVLRPPASSTSGCTARCRPRTGRWTCWRWPRTRRSPTAPPPRTRPSPT